MAAAASTITWPVDGLTWQLSERRIVAVDPNSPGDVAGLQPGDVVVAINGEHTQQLPLHFGAKPGQSVTFTVQRSGGIRDAVLELAPPDELTVAWRLVPLVVALCFWLCGVIVLLLRPRNSTCVAFFFVGQVAAVALAAGQLSAVNVIWAAQLFHLALLAIPPLVAYLYVTLTRTSRTYVRRLPAWLAIISFVFALPQLVALVTWIRTGTWIVFPLTWSAWLTSVRIYVAAALFVLTMGMIFAYGVTKSAHVRIRLRSLAIGALAGFLPLVFLSLLPTVLVGPNAGLPFQAAFLFLILVPLSHAFVIVKHDLTPLDRFFNRSVVVFTLGLLWMGLYLLGVGLGMVVYHETPMLWALVGAAVTIGMAAAFTPLQGWIQRLVDRMFYGGWYDYRSVIAMVSRRLVGITSRQALAERVVEPVAEGLRLQGAALYLRSGQKDMQLERAYGLVVPDRLAPRDVDARLGRAAQAARPLHVSAQKPGDIAWYLPLVQSDQLHGLLLLGAKRDDDFFEPADAHILQTLAEQVALAAANVMLMENLQETLHALQASQQRLLKAREEERRTLAWELHDGPVQDLVALSYQLCECRDTAGQYDPALAEVLESARREATQIMTTTRAICSAMRSDVLDLMGLGPAIIQHAYDVMQKAGVVVYLDVPRQGPNLTDPLGITLLRVFQESLGNAIEHGNVEEVWVRFRLEGDRYELTIWDQGQGFEVPSQLASLSLQGHLGLATMAERMASIDGHLEVHSKPSQGTRVLAWGVLPRG